MIIEVRLINFNVIEEQNHRKESDQLDFLYETTIEIGNEKEEDPGGKSSFKSNEEGVEIVSKKHFPENILILDTETTGLDNENDDCIEVGSILLNVKSR